MPMDKVMHEFKSGVLHSGSKHGPLVHSRSQAIAIGLNSDHHNKEYHHTHNSEKHAHLGEHGEIKVSHCDVKSPHASGY